MSTDLKVSRSRTGHIMRFSRPTRRSLWKQCQWWARLCGVLLVCVMLIVPVRNVLLSWAMPGAWLEHSSFRIIRVLIDNQYFPVEDPYRHSDSDVKVKPFSPPTLSITNYTWKANLYGKYYTHIQRLKERAEKDPLAADELAVLEHFAPTMTTKEKAQLLLTLDVFVQACQQNNLTFFIFEGALLGAYRHHGIVPWDDDVDISMNVSEWRKIRAVLGNVPGFTLYARGDVQWKFYLSDLPPFKDKPFKYPHLDIFFFHEDDTYVWSQTWGAKDHLLVQKKHLFPLTKVYYEQMWLPAPACVERMVISNYGSTRCILPSYVHRTDEAHYGFQSRRTDCSNLYELLPFVFRRHDPKTGIIIEMKKIGDEIIDSVTMQPPPDVCST